MCILYGFWWRELVPYSEWQVLAYSAAWVLEAFHIPIETG